MNESILNLFFNRFPMIRSYLDKRPIKVEDIYRFDNKPNPFNLYKQEHEVQVIAIKQGYINYRWLGCVFRQNEVMSVGSFRYCYYKKQEEQNE